jgi:carbon-monoxide dehydrogenase small subunit
MIMASVKLAEGNPELSDNEVRHGLEGNFCRCTGYENIVRAVQAGASAMAGGEA